ncbi:hypothetical protein A3D01_04940 [Candidatus Woesebacteria bacterium RIFCSPHIGHO2_02_FULL_39_13]|uniref:Transcriptional regulator n=1 Tax=Candidatus Woesebacteria bacterium RIFCSPHIGHO2_02_FULL_39_13 TaxID=1802505 RepID=A0A1F7YZV0_9BACT|nr:MAG: hypothetical protein A2692_00260 [Candidatus Woesebacteria bacterium RIFCSPHIGHO2_01_FULL_39_95]OGM32893.1 MAG: hypothetical protein A3D01_04940 [Candidatus Woesebacteria bacterium RIFCSPHIGHO2_02_FULL_39_13]OGM74406.1 MAG: hypothetical protein A3H19_05250 [Candidatus Woesebacteria bacterium RIFCSPLOWO2_12_FULL_39_9]
MNIPLVDLSAQYSQIKVEVKKAINDVLNSSRFVGGQQIDQFEKEFARYIGTKYCVTVASGTDSLILGIRALNLSSSDEIILPANTFNATAAAVSENGIKPIIVDIDEKDFGINLEDLKRKINSKTKAVIVVHLFGQSDKINEIKALLNKRSKKILLIEDSCQAHGAYFREKRVGSYGVFSGFSFYPGKNLGAYGWGGAITTDNAKLARVVRIIKDNGQVAKYKHQMLGVNSSLDALQAAILLVKLKYLDSWNKKRRLIADLYTNKLNESLPFIITPKEYKDRKSVYHLYIIRVPKRNKLLKYLNERGIGASIHYPTPIHLQKAYKYLGYKRGDLPLSEKIAGEIISLPIYPELTETKINYIVDTIKNFYEI